MVHLSSYCFILEGLFAKFMYMDTSLFKHILFFSELDDNDLELIGKFSRIKPFGKGDIIFFDTEPYLGFYAVVEGMVKIYKISKDGREHIMHIVEPYGTFAEVPLFENAGKIISSDFRYPANAMALTDDTQVLLVPARAFIELLQSNPGLSIRIISAFAKRLRHLNKHIEEVTLKDVTKRVADYILAENKKTAGNVNAKSKANIIELKISKNDLASYLGTIPETLSRTFKKLQDDGAIEVNGKSITIADPDKLKELSS